MNTVVVREPVPCGARTASAAWARVTAGMDAGGYRVGPVSGRTVSFERVRRSRTLVVVCVVLALPTLGLSLLGLLVGRRTVRCLVTVDEGPGGVLVHLDGTVPAELLPRLAERDAPTGERPDDVGPSEAAAGAVAQAMGHQPRHGRASAPSPGRPVAQAGPEGGAEPGRVAPVGVPALDVVAQLGFSEAPTVHRPAGRQRTGAADDPVDGTAAPALPSPADHGEVPVAPTLVRGLAPRPEVPGSATDVASVQHAETGARDAQVVAGHPDVEPVDEADVDAGPASLTRTPMTVVLRPDWAPAMLPPSSALFGRDPEAEPGEAVDTLVAVTDEAMSVSKTHLALRCAEGTVWVCDRQSTNGTSVRLPSGAVVPCPPQEWVRVEAGSTVLIGERALEVALVGTADVTVRKP